MFLSKQHKQTVRGIAARNWQVVMADESLSPNAKFRIAKRNTEHEIISRRYGFSTHGFDSVLTSILISLAVRYAVKLLTKWLEEGFNEGE